jgi:hypothetical protein
MCSNWLRCGIEEPAQRRTQRLKDGCGVWTQVELWTCVAPQKRNPLSLHQYDLI